MEQIKTMRELRSALRQCRTVKDVEQIEKRAVLPKPQYG
jgi:hypothetical protein